MAEADPLSETLLIGTPYKPVAWLGRGGMGEVVEAEHVALGKPVVVKLLHKDLARQPHQVERMRVEAQSLARLAHPNLVMVTDFGQTPEGRPYLVMERLRGRTLKEELTARGVIPVPEAIDVTQQILAGLSAAHSLGLVHRDVKLENLYVCDADEAGKRLVKVLDFGIAKVVGGGSGATPAPSKFPTAEGVLLGTPRFLSPEQAMGKTVDARTDIYSTGMVLYTLVCGRGPFQDMRSLPELLRAHAYVDPEPPSKLAPQPIPAELDHVILMALAKAPDARYQDAKAFSAALKKALEAKAKRWETTEPLASSAKAQAISKAARLALATQSTSPMPQVSGTNPSPPSSPSSPSPSPSQQSSSPRQSSPQASPGQQPLPLHQSSSSHQAAPAPQPSPLHQSSSSHQAAPAQPSPQPAPAAARPSAPATQAMTAADISAAVPKGARAVNLARTAALGTDDRASAVPVLPFRAVPVAKKQGEAAVMVVVVALLLGGLAAAVYLVLRFSGHG